jgi:sugar lactone lactonase YvrE
LVTGVGTPNIAALAQAIGAQNSAPQITAQPVSVTAIPGQNASFSVTASGSPLPAYQWQLRTPGGTTWSNLSSNTTYSGTATATLTVNSVTDVMSGNLFQCVISNANGTATTAPPAALIVTYPLYLSTVAGQAGSSGSADGSGNAARFNDPSDVATDSSGNVYVADTNNHTIRKITPAGVVSTLAGLAGTSGSADGAGSAARFNLPAGLTVDASGNVYVADTYNHTVRKVTATGMVSTVAGLAGTSGSADGTGGNARFNYPSGVCVDSAGNLYVADTNNFTIRKITPAGVVSTVAGLAGVGGISDGTGSAARFSSPEGVTVDGSGNLYVTDTDNHTIRKITPAGAVTTLAGLAGTSGGGDGSGSVAQFQYPSDLTVDSTGILYVADTDNHTIRKITPVGLVGTVAGLAGSSGSTDGVGSAARLFYPTGVAIDGSGNVYVADTNNHTIRKGIIVALPQITAQPQSQTVNAGSSVSFSVTASGSPAPTYQWYNTGVMVGGATSATLTLSNVQAINAGSYYVVVTNVAGSATSNQATLTVNAATPPPSGGGGGGGGGGGAPSLWFYGALSLLVALRKAFRRK